MIVASLLLVIAAAITLLIGLFNRETIEWVYASIASCLVAGLLLTIGVLRSRPSRKPVLQSGGEGQGASWAGASQWGGAAGESAGTDVLSRDDDLAGETVKVTDAPGDEEPTRTAMPTGDGDQQWAPQDQSDTSDLAGPSAGAGGDEDVEVVPKPSARAETAQPAAAKKTAGGTRGAAKKTAAKKSAAAAKKAAPAAKKAAKKTAPAAAETDDAERFEQVLSPISGVGPSKRKALLAHFGTYRKLRAASPEKLAEVEGISRTLADRIHNTLHGR